MLCWMPVSTMRLLCALFAASVLALLWATVSVARHVRRHHAEQARERDAANAAADERNSSESNFNP